MLRGGQQLLSSSGMSDGSFAGAEGPAVPYPDDLDDAALTQSESSPRSAHRRMLFQECMLSLSIGDS